MRPRDYDPAEDPGVYLDALEEWEERQTQLVAAVDAADTAVVAAERSLATLEGIADRLGRLLQPLARDRDALAANDTRLAVLAAELDEISGLLADYTAARELATTRLLGGPAAETPLVLLPLRLQTRWLDDGLHVRIYPDELSVDTHDPTLTAEESRWAGHYWQVRSGAVEADPEETWRQLVRRFGPTRAAWLVDVARPDGDGGTPRPGPLPRPALARLLPDRFAVVAFAGGTPLDMAPAGAPARYVTWSSQVPPDLELAVDDAPGAAWWNDLTAAHANGMAVRLNPPPGRGPIDTLVAVGLRGVRPDAPAADVLTALVAAHAVSAGAELLADDTPTNNAEALRSAHSPQAQERAARAVRDAILDSPLGEPITTDVHALQEAASEPSGEERVTADGRAVLEPSGEEPVMPDGRALGEPSGEEPVMPDGRALGEPSGEEPVTPDGRALGEPSGGEPVTVDDAPGSRGEGPAPGDAVLGSSAGAARTAAARLSGALGVPVRAFAGLAGADAGRDSVPDAVRLLVGLGTQGALRRSLGADDAWPLVRPDGPFPAFRVGRQPYGVLPVTAPGRWAADAGETTAALEPWLREWGAATGPAIATDPGAPPRPVGGGPARTESEDLDDLLIESASSLRWLPEAADGRGYDGLDALVGPADGVAAPAEALITLADTPAADLPALPEQVRAGSLLARIAVAAKRAAPAEAAVDTAVDTALRTLASTGRERLARTLCELLDAASHRFDAWVTAAAAERLTAQRAAHPGETVVGAVGWLTGVAPRTQPRSLGHLHAPSVGHAATAAVLRSAFLGERRKAWAARVEVAAAEVAALRAHLGSPMLPPAERHSVLILLRGAEAYLRVAEDGARRLAPLGPESERRLPLAVDLSSRRLRGALRVLAAVRSGQPLAAVLGHGFERALADAGLLHHLAPFRKLTRFRTGTALEALELERDRRRAVLAASKTRLAELRQTAEQARARLDAAEQALRAAQARLDAADLRYAPAADLEQRIAAANATIQQRAQELAQAEAARPAGSRTQFRVTLP
ncbi:hypothetical protein Aph01nite_48900 [Acrocarpospora phusangensis]|uniref:Uncharacterized protein n=1 Tax=Acrocarpospora phusangensis TaxID=1070424 RepID=A0A919QFS0_9ACTN|nr:hypothetical protein [Acrocarpospora phusangensis]GIH26580.1 hypothetical protein Aph01nite_48900 [Acrocarpospora phusangensis]